jgi:two-component system response regulator YesN
MNRLLVVDDLPIIVDGLVDLFAFEGRHLELEVWKAYSASEALELLAKHRMDIVLSDIKMPGMTGLDLMKEMKQHWPRCKVIFLSSYDQFEYAREATSLGAFDYILKVEGDEKIIACVQKAIEAIAADREQMHYVERAKQQYRTALPLLQKEYIRELIYEGKRSESRIAAQFGELYIPLEAHRKLFLLIGRVDSWQQGQMTSAEKSLLLYAIQNIVEEYMAERACHMSLTLDKTKIVWLFQAKFEQELDETTFRSIYESLDTIQQTCRKLLQVTISFIISRKPSEAVHLPKQFQELSIELGSGLGLGTELILSGRAERAKPDDEQNTISGLWKNKLPKLAMSLENREKDTFFELLGDSIAMLKTEAAERSLFQIEWMHALSSMFLSYINRYDMLQDVVARIELDPLVRFDAEAGADRMIDLFERLARIIFASKSDEQRERAHEVIKQINRYIHEHIDGDLSNVHLADQVYLNPNYLSRLYKQTSQIALSDYITEVRIGKAKELLLHSPLKIHEVAAAVGYQSAMSFIRFFKGNVGVTPQVYRNR